MSLVTARRVHNCHSYAAVWILQIMCFCLLRNGSLVAAGGYTVVQSSRDPTWGQALLHASGHLVHWVHFCRDDQPAPALPRRLCEPFPKLLQLSPPSFQLSTEPGLLS